MNDYANDEFNYDQLLSLTSCQVEKSNGTSLVDNDTAVLSWTLPHGAHQGAKRWLIENRLTLEDFVAAGSQFAGVWRHQGVTSETVYQRGEVTGTKVSHYLAKGYYQTINWDSARIYKGNLVSQGNSVTAGVTGATSNDPEEVYTVIFPFCDPGSVIDMVLSLSANTYANPVAGTETLSGTFYNIVATYDEEDDGTFSILLTLAKALSVVYTQDNFGGTRHRDVYRIANVPKTQVQDIIDAWKTANPIGSFTQASYSDGKHLYDLVLGKRGSNGLVKTGVITMLDCRYAETTTSHYGITETAKDAIVLTQPAPGTTVSRRDNDNGDGTFDVNIVYRVTQYRNVTGLIVSQAADAEVVQQQQLGVVGETPASMTSETGKIKSQRVDIKDDCSKDITTNVDTGKEIEVVTSAVSGDESSTTTEKSYQATEVATPTYQEGKILEVRNADSKYPGKFETLSRERVAINQTAESYEDRHDQSSVVNKETQSTADTAPTAEVGTMVEIDHEPTPFGKKRKVKRTITAKNQTVSAFEDRHDQSAVIEKATQADADTVPTATAGTIVEIDQDPTPFGKHRKSKRTVTAKDQTITEYEKRHDQTASVAKHTQGTAETEPSAPSAGTIVEISQNPTPFGKAQTAVRTVTAVNQTTADYEKRHDQTSSSAKNTQGSAVAEPDAPADGTIVRVSQQPTPFGKAQTVVETITAVAQTVTHDSEARADQTASTAWAKSAAAKADATAVTGKIVRASSRENEFGLFDNTVETVTPIAQTVTHTSESRDDQATETVWAKNATAKADATAVTGKIVRASSRENEFGKFDNVVETITPDAQDVTFASEARVDQTAETVWEKNAAAKAEATPVAGKVVQASSRVNEFGKFDNQKTTVTPITVTVDHLSESRGDQTAQTLRVANADAKVEATAVTGKIVRATSQENPFGKFDNLTETITPVDQTVTDYEKRHDQTAVVVKHTQATAETEPSAPAAGTMVEVSQAPTPFGKAQTAVKTITVADQTATETGKSDDFIETYFEKRDVEKHTHAAASEADVAFSTTTDLITRTVNVPTPAGTVQTTKEVITPSERIESSRVESVDEFGSVSSVQAVNAETIPDATAGIVVTGRRKENARWDYEQKTDAVAAAILAREVSWTEWGDIQWKPYSWTDFNEYGKALTDYGTLANTAGDIIKMESSVVVTPGVAPTDYYEGWTYKEQLGTVLTGVMQVQVETIHLIKYHATELLAAAAINEASAPATPTGYNWLSTNGSYRRIKEGLYQSHKITSKEKRLATVVVT